MTKSVSAHKIITGEILKASAVVTKSDWDFYKADFRSTRGKINSMNWGAYSRGAWLSLGPSVRTMDSAGITLFVEITFLSNDKLWFPVDVWRDEYGNIPDDITPEGTLRADTPAGPPIGSYFGMNGIVWSSIYDEIDFNPVFGFVPE